jgi:hypothetical protein
MFGKIVPGFGPGQVHLILVKKVATLEQGEHGLDLTAT